MLPSSVYSGFTSTLSSQHSAAPSESNSANSYDSKSVLHRTKSLGVVLGQDTTVQNLTVNPAFEFKPVLGKGREERRGIVWKFFNETLSKIYGSQDSKLVKIEKDSSDRTCRLLYDEGKAVGVVVYKKELSNKVFRNSLKINTLDLIEARDTDKNYRSALLNKVEETALQLRAQSIHVTVNSTCCDSIEFFKKNGFEENPLLTLLEEQESNEVFLIKKLAMSHFTEESHSVKSSKTESESRIKRKSLGTSQSNDDTYDSKVLKKRPHISDEQTPNDLTRQFKVLTSQEVQDSNNSTKPAKPLDSSTRFQPGYNSQDSRDRFQRKDPAQRTQYVARRSLPYDANRSPRKLEATLKKIYVNMIKDGTKTIEGRINSGMFKNLREGQLARFFYSGRDFGEVTCEITKVNEYDSFEDMLKTEGFKPCLPDARSLKDAIRTYHSIPGFTERASRSGVVAIHLRKI